jgi:IstB-like ATP binding protein
MNDTPTTAAAPSERAVRNVNGFYDADQSGLIALDGTPLKCADAEYAWSSSWIGSPACPWCPKPEFLHLLPRYHRRCDKGHPVAWPPRNPFPMSPEERLLAEERAWLPIASRCEIPARYRSVRLEDSAPTPAVKAMKEFLARRVNRCVASAGPTGVGKTHVLVGTFRHLAVWDKRRRVAFYTEPHLVRLLISAESEDTFERAVSADLLAIDDVGSAYRKPDGLAEALLEEIFVRREADEAMTLITTNLPVTRFGEVLGDRVADRIAGAWGEWYSLPGRSLRGKSQPRGGAAA